jgi:uncharacterized protein YwbE
MAELKKILKDINNTVTDQTVKISEQANKIISGNSNDVNKEVVNMRDPITREDFFKKLLEANAKLNTLNGIINLLRFLNSSDLCNPLTFAINIGTLASQKAFPKESRVGTTIRNISETVKEYQSALRGFTLIGGNEEAKGFSQLGQEFVASGNITLQIDGISKPKKGATVYITQTDNPKIGSQMVGTVEEILTPTPPLPETIKVPILDEEGNETGEFETLEYYPEEEVQIAESGALPIVINIASLTPIDPPYQKTKNGNTVIDEQGEPITAKFQNFKVTYEKELTTDTKELAREVREITNSLRELGIVEFANDIRDIRSVPGLGKLADLAEDIVKIVNKPIGPVNESVVAINQQGTEIAQTTGQIATVLEGGLTSGQVFERAKIYNDFFRKLEPFINFDFTLENIFKKQIESANTFLRGRINYEDLSRAATGLQKGVKFAIGIVSFILVLLKAINAVIKIVTVIVKVLKAVVKAVKLILKVISFFAGGALAPLIQQIIKIEDALNLIANFLEKISKDLEIVIGKLAYIKLILKEIAAQCGKLAAKFQSCNQLKDTGQTEKILDAAKQIATILPSLDGLSDEDNALFDSYATQEIKDLRDEVGAQADDILSVNKYTKGANGYLLEVRENVFGFDQFGNLVFFGDLVSRTTGVNFEDSEAQEFRSGLRYYTFDKFRNDPIVQQLLLESDRNALLNAEKAKIADPEDIFGNYIEKYLGYTLKIAEEKPVDDNVQTNVRRRGIALDSNERIVASTELTYNNNIATIVNELKFIIKRNQELGIIGINTPDTTPNQISDDDALAMAESIGLNKLAANNLKAEANNRAASNTSGKPMTTIEGRPVNPNSPVETRIGNEPFTRVETDIPARETGNKSSNKKSVDVDKLLSQPFNEYVQSNPSLNKINETVKLLFSADSDTLSSVLSQPGADEFNFEEFTANLKQSVLGSIDPNPEKIQEVTDKTKQWYEGLRAKVRTDWEVKFGGSSPTRKPPPPPFDDYYDDQEQQELPKWVRLLLRQNYTELEVQTGITQDEIKDKYRIKIDGTKVEIKLRPAFKKKNEQ